ncbi:MAG: cytochrome c oxidase subunit II, partial [Ktedonobacterales bacterium]
PAVAAEHASDYVATMIVFTLLAMPVFALVVVFPFYAYYHWRTTPAPVRDGPPIRAGKGIQIVWVGVSTFLVICLYAWGLIFLNRADAAPPPGSNVLHVDVTGEQWNWDFTYPQYGNAQSDMLVVPVNRPILFQITSIDVDHSFSVPDWGIKEDAVPGQFTYIRATPSQMGDFSVRCYELCGLFHAYMEAPVRVVSATDFTAYLAKQPTGYPWGISGAGVPNQFGEPTLPATPASTP